MSLLQVDGLAKSFGGVHAVQGVGFALQAGEMLALIGPNGAGKSTLFNLLGGQLVPDAGRITLSSVQGAPQELAGRSPREIWRMGVGHTFQIAETFASLTVLENVQIALLAADDLAFALWRKAALHKPQEALALLAQVGLEAQAPRPCAALAYGDVKRLELALALAHKPRLLLMDEPTAGMAASERHALMALVQTLVRERGTAVLFTEHSMDVVFAYASRVLVLSRGQLIAQGTPQEVRADAQVQAVYFGGGKTFASQSISSAA